MKREEIIVALLKAAGGQMDGRVRLHKVAYLLDRLGMESGFRFDYHHYGPFSRDLDNAVADAEAFELVEEAFDRREIDGARYSIFKLLAPDQACPERIGKLEAAVLQSYLRMFAEANVTVLELAATAHWLAVEEERADWQEALCRRKGPKAAGGRLDRALALLRDVGLPPAKANAEA